MVNAMERSDNRKKICGVDKDYVYTFLVFVVFLLFAGVIAGLVMLYIHFGPTLLGAMEEE